MHRIGQEEIDEIAKVIASKQLFRTGDPNAGFLAECENFEKEWADYIGSKHALLMTGGGTAALICSLAALGIGPGDEVIVPAYTWLATASSALAVGAIPVLAEVDETLALDPDDFEAKIGPNTRAVIPVHMAGRPANMGRIVDIAKKHGLFVVEDACQNAGGSFHGRKTGTWGDINAFSFNHFKTISCGEGGAITTDDENLFERAFIYHDSGAAFRPSVAEFTEPIFVAQQYRANEIMGAIMRVQLRRLNGILQDLRRIRKSLEATIDSPIMKVAPSNDPEGDCGSVLALQFDDAQTAREYSNRCGIGSLGIDHGKHVYVEWEPIREKLVNHRPDMNPFNFPQNQGLRADYSEDACPRTLDLLRRTYFIGLSPDMTESDIQKAADRIGSAGEGL